LYIMGAGGLRFDEPAADVAIAAAVASCLRERPVRDATAIAGEVALSGRLRVSVRAERRVAEARRLGFERLVTGGGHGAARTDGLVVARDIREAIGLMLRD
jgi:DNA repair protein RadA/Sms